MSSDEFLSNEDQLVKAVAANALFDVRRLLGYGVNPDLTTKRTRTPLLHLALYTQADDALVQALLDAKADPMNIDASGRTAVVVAELMGRTDVLPLLQAA